MMFEIGIKPKPKATVSVFITQVFVLHRNITRNIIFKWRVCHPWIKNDKVVLNKSFRKVAVNDLWTILNLWETINLVRSANKSLNEYCTDYYLYEAEIKKEMAMKEDREGIYREGI